MKKLLALILTLFLASAPALAVDGSGNSESGDTRFTGILVEPKGIGQTNVVGVKDDTDAFVFKIPNTAAGLTRTYGFDLDGMRQATGGLIETDTTPAFATQSDGIGYIEMADGFGDAQTERVKGQFVVPADYRANGVFNFYVALDDFGGADSAIDFEMWVNGIGVDPALKENFISFATSGLADAKTMQQIGFATASLATGSVVTFQVWRVEDANNATASVRLYGADFFYSSAY